jgi:exosortase/archaeosortase family protein
MYKPVVAGGAVTSVLGLKVTKQSLPFTGFTTVAYILLGIALLVTGLLLARLGRARGTDAAQTLRRERLTRAAATAAVATTGLLILVFAGWFRGLETWTTAHSIGLVTPDATTGIFSTGIVVMHHGTTSAAAFALTPECSVAQIMGAILIGGAPLLLVRRLSMLRVGAALLVASVVLVVANILRLTAIGVAIQAWGDNGFSLAHTYLGSLVTFVGTCLAGVAFALVLVARRRREAPALAQS